MKWGVSGKLGLHMRLGIVITIAIVSIFGCINPLKTQSVQSMPSPSPYATSADEVTATEESLLQLSPVPTIQPSSSLEPMTLPSEIVQEMLGQTDKEEALSVLRGLTGEEPICIDSQCYTIKNRGTGTEGLRWAKNYLYKELVRLGYSVEYQDWSLGGYSDQNVIATKIGKLHPNEEIYLVAHLDGKKKFGVNRFPAADDNASGAVDLLEVARALRNYSFDRSLVFFFSTGEEEGTLGVQSYLQELSPEELGSIKYVINVDMVGYDDNRDGAMELWYGDDPKSFALTQIMKEIIQAYKLALSPKFVVGCG